MNSESVVGIRVQAPVSFDRVQLLLRIAILVAMGVAGASMGWVGFVLYLTLPVLAAVSISSRGGPRYLAEVAPTIGRGLGWVVSFYAYMILVIDRFPTSLADPDLQIDIQLGGAPTVGGALLRWVTSLPSAVVFALLGVVTGLLALVGAVCILLTGKEPPGILQFQAAMVRWNARLLAYHASLVEQYPPFSLAGPEDRRHAPGHAAV